MIPSSIAIIGGSGFLGGKLIRALSNSSAFREIEVRSIDRVQFPFEHGTPERFTPIIGDARDIAFLSDAIEGVDAVWIRAGKSGGWDSIEVERCCEYLDSNVQLAASVVKACTTTGCSRIYFDSSEQVFGESADIRKQLPESEATPCNFYGATKLIVEKHLFKWVSESHRGPERSAQIMRYSRVHGPETRDVIHSFAMAALSGGPIKIFGDGDHQISFVHIDDVIETNMTALRRRPRFAIEHVSSGRPITLFELALRIRESAKQYTSVLAPIVKVDPPSQKMFEPFVVGMAWEPSGHLLGKRPISLDFMIEETLESLVGSVAAK